MQERPDATYDESFDSRRYLEQYYSLPRLAADDADLFRFLSGWLRSTGREYDRALDVGCGPTLHNTFAIAPFARSIDLADYLDANLEQIRMWIREAPEAHDWDPLLRGVLECEGSPEAELEPRKALYRRRVRSFRHCDLRLQEPLGAADRFDLVTSFFCTECVAETPEEWRTFLGRILRLVNPGGSVFLAAIRESRGYEVRGRWFATVPITEVDVMERLEADGFDRGSMRSVAVDAPDWVEHGFSQICLVAATRKGGEA